MKQTKKRSGWAARRTLAALGISRGSYYRWLKEEAWTKEQADVRPVQAFEALPEERAAVLAYARQHPEIRHRELAWRMIDEEVAFLSSSTVYRILREANLMCRQRGRKKRYREEIEKATRPDERWGTDLMYVTSGAPLPTVRDCAIVRQTSFASFYACGASRYSSGPKFVKTNSGLAARDSSNAVARFVWRNPRRILAGSTFVLADRHRSKSPMPEAILPECRATSLGTCVLRRGS